MRSEQVLAIKYLEADKEGLVSMTTQPEFLSTFLDSSTYHELHFICSQNRAVVTFEAASAATKAIPEWNGSPRCEKCTTLFTNCPTKYTHVEIDTGCKFNDFEVRLSAFKQPSAPKIEQAPAPAKEAAPENEGDIQIYCSLLVKTCVCSTHPAATTEEQEEPEEESEEQEKEQDVRARAAKLKQQKQKQARQKQQQRKRELAKRRQAEQKKLQQEKRKRQQQQQQQQKVLPE